MTSWTSAVARSWRSKRWRKRRMVVASGVPVAPGSIPANARQNGISRKSSSVVSSQSANLC